MAEKTKAVAKAAEIKPKAEPKVEVVAEEPVKAPEATHEAKSDETPAAARARLDGTVQGGW